MNLAKIQRIFQGETVSSIIFDNMLESVNFIHQIAKYSKLVPINYILIVILVSFGINSRHLDNPTAKLAIRASLGGTAMATLLFGLVKKIITL